MSLISAVQWRIHIFLWGGGIALRTLFYKIKKKPMGGSDPHPFPRIRPC